MRDLISRNALVEYCLNTKDRTIDANDIMRFPSAEPEWKWIPVTQALPEEKGEYLVSYHPCHWNTVSEKVVVGMDTFRGKTTWAKMKYQKVYGQYLPLARNFLYAWFLAL